MVTSRLTRRAIAGLIMPSVALVAATGCFGPAPTEPATGFDPTRFGGVVDASLPAEERQRREILRRLLLGIVAGEDIALIAKWLPGVEFRESHARFFNGNVLLRRWAFAPSPGSGVIAVTLEFVPADDAVTTSVEQRAYEVTGRPGAWVVRRSDPDPALT